jgi:hypothetical protein
VYAGGDPSTVATFELIGVYQIGRPMGNSAYVSVNGDILVATELGLVSMRSAMSNGQDGAAIEKALLTREISNDWRRDAVQRRNETWELIFYPERQCIVIKIPSVENSTPYQWVYNIITKAWARMVGWDTRSIISASGRIIFGSIDGKIKIADTGSSNDDVPYTCSYLSCFSDCGSSQADIAAKIVSCELFASREMAPLIFSKAQFERDLPTAPATGLVTVQRYQWDGPAGVAQWDKPGVVWDAKREPYSFSYRESASGVGRALATGVMITVGGGPEPDCELTMTGLQIERLENVA